MTVQCGRRCGDMNLNPLKSQFAFPDVKNIWKFNRASSTTERRGFRIHIPPAIYPGRFTTRFAPHPPSAHRLLQRAVDQFDAPALAVDRLGLFIAQKHFVQHVGQQVHAPAKTHCGEETRRGLGAGPLDHKMTQQMKRRVCGGTFRPPFLCFLGRKQHTERGFKLRARRALQP